MNGPRLLPAAALAARAASIPLVFHSHHRLLQPIAVRLAAESLRWSQARVIACCRFAAEPLRERLNGDGCRVVYNGVAEPSWARRGSGSPKSWNIGVIGRVEPEKGQMGFVEAARILSAEFAACRFIIAGAPMFSGPDYLERVKDASRRLPIEFHGWQDDIGAVFSKLDLLVVPSSDIDSTPRVVIEAFSAGIPVVAFPSGGIPEIVEDGKTGFLASAASPAALAARIRSVLLMESGPLREVAESAREAWRAKYTLDRYQEEVAEVIGASLFVNEHSEQERRHSQQRRGGHQHGRVAEPHHGASADGRGDASSKSGDQKVERRGAAAFTGSDTAHQQTEQTRFTHVLKGHVAEVRCDGEPRTRADRQKGQAQGGCELHNSDASHLPQPPQNRRRQEHRQRL